jgi:hypothetical protein
LIFVAGVQCHTHYAMASDLWYRAPLSDEGDVGTYIAAIGQQFAAAVGAVGWPDGACLFVTGRHARMESPRRDEADEKSVTPMDACELFFSPASVSAVPHLIVLCKATPSPPPERILATLIVGKETDWDLLPRPTH